MFLQLLSTDPSYYFAVVITLIVSITMHELAHGFAALRLGDQTPVWSGHMTGNPLVHMGPVSIACVFLAGFGWGAMPVDPTRLRGRYGDVIVSLAGPASNLVLGFAALTLLGVLERFDLVPAEHVGENTRILLFVCGAYNLILALFNLIPIPPMDGSRILAGFNRGYRDFISREEVVGAANAVFIVLFLFGGRILFPPIIGFAQWYVGLIDG
jgi:Zn-dependent protease